MSNQINQLPKEIKVLLLGESNVGKTSIFNRFIENKYEANISSTIGVDFESKTLTYKNNKYTIKLFDTAGQERFRSITQSYFRMGDAFFFVFDITNEHSFQSIPGWIDLVKEVVEDPKFIILANKDDIKDKVKISDETIKNKLGQYNIIKTSALKNTNIKKAFDDMIKLVESIASEDNNEEQIGNNRTSRNNSIKVTKNSQKNRSIKMKCC